MNADSFRECLTAYDSWAATYNAIDNPLIAQAAEVLSQHASWFAGARVLELGCGTGRNAGFCLSSGVRRYVGVDAAPGMLSLARAKFANKRVSWIHSDLVTGSHTSLNRLLLPEDDFLFSSSTQNFMGAALGRTFE